MANIKYSDLLEEVLPSLAADPSDPVTEAAIKRAVIEFCARTLVWKYLPDPANVVAGEAVYDLETEIGSDIALVMNVLYDGVALVNKSTDWLDQNTPDWRTLRETPAYFTQVNTEQIILAGVPDSNITTGLVATVALQPSYTSTGFPKWLFNQHVYALADGAIARLMLMPGKPWTDLKNGVDRRASFEACIANTRALASMALGRAATRTTAQH